MNPLFLFNKRLTPIKKLLLLHMAADGSLIEYTATGNPVSFVTDIAKELTQCLLAFSPVQSGSGDPSPENIRPITGHTGLTVYHSGQDTSNPTTYPVTFPAQGKNLFNKATVTENKVWWKGTQTSGYADYCATEKIPVIPGDTYRFYRDMGTQSYVSYFDVDGNYTGTQAQWTNSIPVHVIPEGVYFIGASMLKTSVDTAIFSKGESQIPYEPFTNTVYGGSLDLVTGVLTVTEAQIASYNGEELPGKWISDRDAYASGTTPTIGAQVVYQLATPIVYQLTPQQITALVGDNVLWSDINGDMEVKYMKKG